MANPGGLYRVLLLAYPAEFREEYGPEMERFITERMATESRLRVWLALFVDVAMAAPREHWQILSRDLRHSVRLLAKAPGFAATAIIALALGICAAVTIFSLINAVLIRQLPYGDADRLGYLWSPLPRYASLPRELGPSFANVLEWRETSRSFTEITMFQQRMFSVESGAEGLPTGGAFVLGNFFQTLRAAPLLGRAIELEDDQPGHERVAVISYALWRSQFNLDPGVIGQSLRLNKTAFRVIGVMPEGFAYPHRTDFPISVATIQHTDVWVPAALTPRQRTNRLQGPTAAVGRLRNGVTWGQAQAEMSAIAKQLDALNLPEMQGTQSLVLPFIDTAVGPVRTLLRLLAGAVVLVLMIACGNVASLLMARAAGRVHEAGVRTALGAPKARLVRQLLTESLMLSLAGGCLGAMASVAMVKAVARLNPGDIPRFEDISIDLPVLGFAVGISLLSGLVFGILPAFATTRVDVSELLRQGGRGSTGRSSRIHAGLVVGDVALAVVLLVAAGLLIRSYLHVQGEDKGFAASTLTMNVGLDRQPRTPQQVASLYQSVVGKVAALPGITTVGATSLLPLSHHENTSTFRVDGYPNQRNQMADLRLTAGDYCRAMDMRLIAGRFLNSSDIPAEPVPVPRSVVVSESFARIYFPAGNALGGRLQRGTPGNVWSTIVGIVADVRHASLEKTPRPTIYEPSWFVDSLAIRTALPPDAIVSGIRRAVREIDPAFALSDIQTMQQRIGDSGARRRFQTVLLAAFAAIAVLLALVGLYGLLSYAVRVRTAEIGVRMTLGADRGAVIGMVVRNGLLLVAGGLAIGLPAAAAMARWISTLLYGVRALDPVTFIAVPVVLLLAAATAAGIPAWKAARIDPVHALRVQ